MKEIQEHKIKIYEFPDTEEDEDSKLIRKIKVERITPYAQISVYYSYKIHPHTV